MWCTIVSAVVQADNQRDRWVKRFPGSKTSGLQLDFVLKKHPFITCKNSEKMRQDEGFHDLLCHISDEMRYSAAGSSRVEKTVNRRTFRVLLQPALPLRKGLSPANPKSSHCP